MAAMSRAGRYVLSEAAALAWPVSAAVVSRVGRYLLPEVAVVARVGGRYEP